MWEAAELKEKWSEDLIPETLLQKEALAGYLQEITASHFLFSENPVHFS